MRDALFICLLICIALVACAPQSNEEKNLQAFINANVQLIEPKLKAMNLANWNASTTGETKYYDENAKIELEIRKIYSNKLEFDQLKAWKESGKIEDPLLVRQMTVLYNSYLPNQIDTALTRQIVEKSAKIAEIFNTFRGTLGGKTMNDNDISDILRTETDSNKRKLTWEASKQVGQIVASMVIELVKLRNQAARQLGYENYYVMSLAAAEQDEKEILSIFDELKRLTDEPFRLLKAQIDSELAAKYGIPAEQMRPWHYQDRFFQEMPKIGNLDLDAFFKGKKVDDIARTFYQGIGLPVDDVLERSDIFGRPKKYQHAFCTDIDRLGDIRVILSVTDNHYWMSTMLHELGHAAYSKYIRRDLPFLLRDAAHTFTTEAIAQLMERQTQNPDWLEKMANISAQEKETVKESVGKNLRLKELVFCRWSLVMVYFEQSLYRNPDQDLNALWWNLVEECQYVKRPENRDKPDWAAKIHLALYPVYYHNYMLGELAASQILDAMDRKALNQPSMTEVSFAGKPEVGRFLMKAIFEPGMSLTWNDLMKKATGEPLSAKCFAKEFVE